MLKMTRKHSLIVTMLCSLVLTACGGGDTSSGESKPNTAPSVVVTPSQIDLESGETKTVAINATDDDGAPTLAVQSVSANVKTELSADGKTLSVTANNVTASESGSVSVIATEVSSTKLQATGQLSVKLYPKLDLYALVNGTERVKSLTVEYAKPLSVRIADEANKDIPFTGVSAKDPTIVKVQSTGSVVTLTSLKAGETSVVVTGTLSTGHQYSKTLQVKAMGNQMPSFTIMPSPVTLQEFQSTQLALTINDPDGSYFQSRNAKVVSSDTAIATAVVKDDTITVSGVKVGTATITATIVDGEFTVTSTVAVTVTPEIPPTIVINNNLLIELEEMSSISVPLEIVGSRASEYTPSLTVESSLGVPKDINYSITGNVLTITVNEATFPGSNTILSFTLKASATNGRNTIASSPVSLDLVKRTNGVPIFEFPNRLGSNIMLPKDGATEIIVKVNDDNAKNVVLSAPEAWFNDSKTGTYTVTYDDATRMLKLNLTGFERNERFGIFLSYKDGNKGGKFTLSFRTYDLMPLDAEILEARKVAIAKVEAARAYQYIAQMYAEHLENLGLVDSQFVDELLDELIVDDTKNNRFSTAEYYLSLTLENAYNGDFSKSPELAETFKSYLLNLPVDAHEINKTAIDKINEMAAKSNGYFPSLVFEQSFGEVSSLQYSKFFGKDAYGSSVDGKWQYSPTYKFLTAIDAKVNEKTANRLK